MFALGITKGFIELRKADKMPLKVVTSLTRKVKRNRWERQSGDWPRLVEEFVNKKIEVIDFRGGRKVKILSTKDFTKRYGISIRLGGIAEIPFELAADLKEVAGL